MRALVLGLVGLVLSTVSGCSSLKPGRCNSDNDCQPGYRCDLDPTPEGNGRCVAKGTDGGDAGPDVDGGSPGDAPTDQTGAEAQVMCGVASCAGASPICDGTSKVCRACGAGSECSARDVATPVCLPTGACAECGASSECGVAAKPVCEATSNTCRACGTGAECAARDTKLPACATSGSCVECVANVDCKVAGKPICSNGTNTCRACKADTECPADPGVCMEDGHCATAGEVIFVEFNPAGCPNADGSSTKPYCASNDGLAQLSAQRRVLVLRGAADRMVMATSGVRPVVVGRKSSSGDSPAISAGSNGVALTVTADDVLIRDLTLASGVGANAKGAVITGIATKATLRRVTVALGMGIGIDAEGGATLFVDQSYIQGNSVGGILVNGAKYDIQNSVISGNGYGVQFLASVAGSQFAFNTLAEELAGSCDPGAPPLRDSIVVGKKISCTLENSLTAAPTFSATKPFHLISGLLCPAAPTTIPDHDIDGDPRVAPIDCGADQYVP